MLEELVPLLPVMMISITRYPTYGLWIMFGYLYVKLVVRKGSFFKCVYCGRDRSIVQ